MTRTEHELMELISTRVDPDMLIELLDISTEELVDVLRDKIIERAYQFEYLIDEADAWSDIDEYE